MTSSPEGDKRVETSEAVLARLAQINPRYIDLSLDRIKAFLAALGNPHHKLPPVIHVAGTNGKGSTLAFLTSICRAAGLSVHRYTSPHLVRFHERITLNNAPISDGELTDVLTVCEATAQNFEITYFEIITAAAFLAFSRRPADVLLLEVGLGGKLDATNVIDAPLASVITPVSYDHQDYLGSDLGGIAGEKAGIIKQGRPCIVAEQDDTVRDVIETVAAEKHAPIFIAGQDFSSHEEHGRLVYQDENGLLDLPLPNLVGRFQLSNAALAIAALRYAQLPSITDDAIEVGITSAVWPARMQRLTSGPLLGDMRAAAGTQSAMGELWLDGGHNPQGGEAVAQTLADLDTRSSRPIYLIIGMLNNKDAEGYLRNFTGLVRHVVAIPIPDHDNCHNPEDLCTAAQTAGLAATSAGDISAALGQCLQHSREDGEEAPRILICGSLYLAGEILNTHA